jgi:hypothetical protein
VVRSGPFGVACAVVELALAASAHGDSLSSYKKQVAGGPAAQAIGAAIDALPAGDLKRAEVASLKAPDEPHALALLPEVEMRQGHPANAMKYLQTAVAKNPKTRCRRSDGAVPGGEQGVSRGGIGIQKGDRAGPQVGGGANIAGRLLSGAGPICAGIDSVSSRSCRGSKEWRGASGVGPRDGRRWGRAKLREGVTNGCHPDAKLGSAACGAREPAVAEGAG